MKKKDKQHFALARKKFKNLCKKNLLKKCVTVATSNKPKLFLIL